MVLVSPEEKSESILEISFNYSEAQQIKNKIAVFAWNYNENAAFLRGCWTGLSHQVLSHLVVMINWLLFLVSLTDPR